MFAAAWVLHPPHLTITADTTDSFSVAVSQLAQQHVLYFVAEQLVGSTSNDDYVIKTILPRLASIFVSDKNYDALATQHF